MTIFAMIVFMLCVAATASAVATLLYVFYKEVRRGNPGAIAILPGAVAVLVIVGFAWSSEVLFP